MPEDQKTHYLGEVSMTLSTSAEERDEEHTAEEADDDE